MIIAAMLGDNLIDLLLLPKMASSNTLSNYFEQLDDKNKARYREKIALIGNIDTYSLKKQDFSTDRGDYPNISYPDIVNYMLFALSPWTREEAKCYKSLDSYNQFLSGRVKDVTLNHFKTK